MVLNQVSPSLDWVTTPLSPLGLYQFHKGISEKIVKKFCRPAATLPGYIGLGDRNRGGVPPRGHQGAPPSLRTDPLCALENAYPLTPRNGAFSCAISKVPGRTLLELDGK